MSEATSLQIAISYTIQTLYTQYHLFQTAVCMYRVVCTLLTVSNLSMGLCAAACRSARRV